MMAYLYQQQKTKKKKEHPISDNFLKAEKTERAPASYLGELYQPAEEDRLGPSSPFPAVDAAT